MGNHLELNLELVTADRYDIRRSRDGTRNDRLSSTPSVADIVFDLPS
jgi:hypothetical protein